MRPIIFVTHDGYRLPTARIRCYRFAEELARRGAATRVISTVDHLGARYDGPARRKLSDTRRILLNRRLLHAIRETPDAVIYLQKVDYHALAPWLAHRLHAMPLVLDYDDYDLHLPPFHLFDVIPGRWPTRITRRLVQLADARVVSSHYLQALFDDWKPGTHLIPTGVDTERFFPGVGGGREKDERVILSWVGVVWGEPVLNSLEFLLRCFARVPHREQAVLRLQGAGALWPSLERLVAEMDHGVAIELRGWVPPDEAPAAMDAVDVGVLPLLQDTPFNRAKSPTKLFEYMALGKPAIAGRIGEACHVIEDERTGVLVSTEDDWVAAMDAMITDADRRAAMGRQARARVEERYALTVLGEQLYRAIEEIAA